MENLKYMQLGNKHILFLFCSFLFFACEKGGSLFDNPSSEETGIGFENTITETDDLNILDYLYFYNGGGVAAGDINNDGLVDIFFSGNQVKNKLYLNKGDLQFEDISESAGVAGESSWNTGAIMGDVNGDGLLDIYVCAVVGINGFRGYNELFINNGDNSFTESASKYGLDFDSYSSSAAFFDYDLDGDLDLYLLNHAVHTQDSYGNVGLRNTRSYETGDKLLRNDNGKFVDVSETAGIYGGINSYGLGLAISDFNQDGFPDVYVGNDFHEDDYYYLNNGDGTFTESLRTYFGHTSRFSMGNDVADINNDGLPDLISLDMLPQDEIPLKSSEGDDNIQVQKLRIKEFGYHYQFTRNMLYVNQPDGHYLETALMSGVAATDWSWSALFADYNLDGKQDLFISNGIPRRPNDLDFINYVSNEQIKKTINNTKLVDTNALSLMPSGVVANCVYEGNGDLSFTDRSTDWIQNDTIASGATAIADLDNDGDLDLIANTINSKALVYVNKTRAGANYLKLKFKLPGKNSFGVGTKVYSYSKGEVQFKELFPSRGFQASSEPIIHFGYGENTMVDSLKIVWPNQTYDMLREVATGQTLTVSPKEANPLRTPNSSKDAKPLFTQEEERLGIDFEHVEDNYTDFTREKLIPYQISDRGPAFAQGDINGDGRADLLFGGSKYRSAKIYIQSDTAYVPYKFPILVKDSVQENVTAVIADFNNDAQNDVLLGAGGGDFFGKASALIDKLFIQNDSTFQKTDFPELFGNTSVIKPNDFDGDGDLDLFVGSHAITNSFGTIPTSYLLENQDGTFVNTQDFAGEKAGMVTDAIWTDFNADGATDLIVIGEWMAPQFYKNRNGKLVEDSTLKEEIKGLWQTIIPFDLDSDGDTDYLLGNWGTNSKYTASSKAPLRMYYSDFDNNGKTETVLAVEKNGSYYPLSTLNDLGSQMIFLKKKFNSYSQFAGKSISDIFEKEQLENAVVLEVNELRTGYLENKEGSFSFVPFSEELQVSPIMAFAAFDFDGNGKTEVLAAGNYFGVKPYHGRFDSFPGALISSENDIRLGSNLGLSLTQKSARHLSIIHIQNTPYLLVTYNNHPSQVYALSNNTTNHE